MSSIPCSRVGGARLHQRSPGPLRAARVHSRMPLMGTIYLVRHAQASFGTDDYDRLSPLG